MMAGGRASHAADHFVRRGGGAARAVRGVRRSLRRLPAEGGHRHHSEEAVADLRAFILIPMPPLPAVPTSITGNPWAEVAGTMKGHPY